MKPTNADNVRYLRDFSEPMEFWTSEDGTLMSLVIRPTGMRQRVSKCTGLSPRSDSIGGA